MQFRPYDPDKDKSAAQRIWREVGWLGDRKEDDKAFDYFLGGGRVMVAEVQGAAECLVLTMPATIRYLQEDLSMSAVCSVTTSHVARKQRMASRLTARTIALDVADGALVAQLGVFDQGYYDRFGFGTGCYEDYTTFDPARLKVDVQHRVPSRIDKDDWEQAHAARLARRQRHGCVSLLPAAFTRAEMLSAKNPWGLGYRDGPEGTLSHYIWGGTGGKEHGPYRIDWMVFQNREQFLELMALLKSLGDQVHAVGLVEPPDVQLQDLMEQPLKQYRTTAKSPFAAHTSASAWWQVRICDLRGCLARTRLPGTDLRFNLDLGDPIERYLDADAPWRGVGGDYVVTLGDPSCAEPGHDPDLPTLKATVNAFTRLWMGVRPATSLSYTDQLDAPQELLEALDWALRLPEPKRDWGF